MGMALKGYVIHLEKHTEKNEDFRRVLYTGKHSQLVLMSLKPGEEIGEEVHEHIDQFFRFESGEGVVFIDGVPHKVHGGDATIVPAGAKHNVANTSGRAELKFYTIYSPPEHIDKTVRRTKADAQSMPEEYDGKPTE
jgi:mannose-6-phosphate isomerase-like protein (cupin superfamily)